MTSNITLLSSLAGLLSRYALEVETEDGSPAVALVNVNPALVACGLPVIKRQASRGALVRRLVSVRQEVLSAIEALPTEPPAKTPDPEQPAPDGASEESLRYLEERGWVVERGPTPEEIEEQKRHAEAVAIAAEHEAQARKAERVRMLAAGATVPALVAAKAKAAREAKAAVPKAESKRGQSKTAFVFARLAESVSGDTVENIAADLEQAFPGLVVSGGPRHFVRYILGRANAGDVASPFERALLFTKVGDGTIFVSRKDGEMFGPRISEASE